MASNFELAGESSCDLADGNGDDHPGIGMNVAEEGFVRVNQEHEFVDDDSEAKERSRNENADSEILNVDFISFRKFLGSEFILRGSPETFIKAP